MEPTDQQPTVHGLHHVTVMAGPAQENLDFYTRVLGMRLVKRSINQDVPDTYHLFYADGAGTPGTDLTFFPWPNMRPASRGVGQIVEVPFAVPEGSLSYWQERLEEHDVAHDPVETRFDERALPFQDPHGLHLAIVETNDVRDFVPWEPGPVPVRHQLRNMHAVRLWERQLEPTETLLTRIMGFEKMDTDDGWHRYGDPEGASGSLVDVKVLPDQGPGRRGTGGVHHAAWLMKDEDEQTALRQRIEQVGLRPSPPIDRFWFTSVYFNEPGGVLFELATEGPGFTRDEELEHLGEQLILPPWMEGKRREIEAALPPLDVPVHG